MKNNPMHPPYLTEQKLNFANWEAALELANAASRCGAKTRRLTPCKAPAMANGRCRMHGGKSTGAPHGNRNAYKTGKHIAEIREMKAILREIYNMNQSII